MAKQFSFDELDNSMSKIDSLGSKMTLNTYSKIDEWIGTGNYLLNAQISGSVFKGIPNSRSIVFSGVSGCLHPSSKINVYVSEDIINRKIVKID
jgi:hypothetical protein